MANKIGVVLALDGEQKFAQGMKNAQTAAKNLQSDLKALSSEFKENANSQEYLSQRQEKLKSAQDQYERALTNAKSAQSKAREAYKEQAKEVESLRESYEKARSALEKMDKSSSSYDKQAAEVQKWEHQLNTAEKTLGQLDTKLTQWDGKVSQAERDVKNNSKAVDENARYLDEARNSADHCATSIDKFGNEVREAGTEAKTASGEVKTLGQKIKDGMAYKAGALATEGIQKLGQKAVEAAKYVVDVGSTFEASMSKVEALSGAAGSELEALKEKASELGRTTQFSASEAADALSSMALAGWSTQEMLTGIDGVLELAAAGGMTLASAADAVAGYLAAFNMQASESSRLADIMATAQAKSKTSTDQLAEAYGTCATNLTQAGQSVETTTALIEGLASVNDTGSAAGTRLSAVMAQITKKMQDGKIAIGDTKVAVTDENGAFRDMVDIVEDVEKATEGMVDAERASALQKTFNRQSTAGMNELLSVGSKKLREYKTDLENADGAAKSMAGVVNDNLKGAMKELNSAQEGLGTALYDKVSGPMTAAVKTATGLINGITDAITPQKSELEKFIDETNALNESVQQSIDSSKNALSQGETDIASLEASVQIIKDANEQFGIFAEIDTSDAAADVAGSADTMAGSLETVGEAAKASGNELDEWTKYEVKNRIDELAQSIPQLADAWDDTTGSLKITEAEFDALIDKQKRYIMQSSIEKAKSGAVEAYADALMAQSRAQSQVNKAQEEYDKLLKLNEESEDYLRGGYGSYYKELLEAGIALDKAKESQEQANEGFQEAVDTMNEVEEAAKDVEKQYGMLSDAEGDVAESTAEATEATEEQITAQKELAKTAYDTANEIKKAHTDAADALKTAYEEAKEAIEGTFDIDLGSEFDGGLDITVEKMIENMQTQIEGMQNYEQNLAEVKDHVGKEIAPEFMQYLEDMGQDGANILAHIVQTFKQDNGPETVKKLSDDYVKALDMRDGIAQKGAANKIAAELANEDFVKAFEEDRSGIEAAVAYLQEAGGEVSDSTLDAFNEAIENAKEAGVAIPEGLQSGIESGIDDPEAAIQHATDLLNSALNGQGSELLEIAKEVGANIPEGYEAAIEEGGSAAVEAMQSLVANISEATSDAEAAGEEAGEAAGTGTASGLEGKSGEVQSAGTAAAGKGAEGARSKASEFMTTGSNLGSNLASGINQQSGAAYNAGFNLASAAKSGAENVGGFSSIGYNMSSGIADGIGRGDSLVINAMVSQVNAAVRAAKNAAGIRSPSRVFRDQIGKQISAGVAFGIKQETKQTEAAAISQVSRALERLHHWMQSNKKKIGDTGAAWADDVAYAWNTLFDKTIKNGFGIKEAYKDKKTDTWVKTPSKYNEEVFRAAQQYMNNVQSLYDVSDQQQLDYWKKVRDRLQNGTQAWFDANTKVTEITKKIKDDAKRAAEEAKQAVADARAQVLSDAETYVQSMKEANKMSIADEYAYWKKVREQLKKGTAEWKTATQYIRECKEKIGTINAADSLLSNYQTYYDMSLRAEMQYWAEIRKHYAAGTEARIQADQKYLDAKEKYNEKLKSIEDDYAQKISDANQKYTDALEQRKDAIMSSYDLFDYFESSSASGEELLFNLQTQAAGYKEWSSSLAALSKKGILSDKLMDELTEKGPQSIASIKALLTLTTDQLKDYQKAYDEKEKAAAAQARKDTADVKAEVAEEVKALKEAQKTELAEIKEDIGADILSLALNIKSIAEDQTSALVAAFTAAGSKLTSSTGSSVSAATVTSSGASSSVVNTATAAAKNQSKGMTASTAAAKAEYDKKLKDAQKEATAAQKAVTKAESTLASANAALTKAAKALEKAKANQKTVNANKKSTAKQKENAKTAVTTATTTYNSAKTAVTKAKSALTAAQKTLKEKNAAVTAIKKAGYRKGTKRIGEDGLVWMDEDLASVGAEMIVRKSDNAILTRAKASDAVIPADLAANLFKWGAINPETISGASMASLNQRLLEGYQQNAKAAAQQNDRMDRMLELMMEFMPYLAERMTVPIVSRDAVSVMSDDISRDMAARYRRTRR